MRLPLAMALRRSSTILEETYMQRRRFPSFHEKMNAGCFLPVLQALQSDLMHGFFTLATEPFAAGQSS